MYIYFLLLHRLHTDSEQKTETEAESTKGTIFILVTDILEKF